MKKKQKNTLKQKWQAILDSSFLPSPSRILFSACNFDYDGDGHKELCMKRNNNLIVIKDNRIFAESRSIMLPLPASEERSEPKSFEIKKNQLDLKSNDIVHSSLNLERRNFGFGFTFDYHRHFKLGWDYVGFYDDIHDIVNASIFDCNEDGQEELVVVRSNGEVVALSFDLKILFRFRLPAGIIDQAYFIPNVSDAAGDGQFYVLTVRYYQKRRFGLYKSDFKPYAFMIRNNSIVGSLKEAEPIACLPGQPGKLATHSGKIITISNKRILESEKNESERLFGSTKHAILSDHFNANRFLIVKIDSRRQSFTIANSSGEDLWSHDLPISDSGYYDVIGVLGPEQTIAKPLIAIMIKTEKILPDFNAKVTIRYVYIFKEDGTFLGNYEFPPNGEDYDTSTQLILNTDDDSERMELIILSQDQIRVFDINETLSTSNNLPAIDGATQSLPRFEAPEEDLWNIQLW